jgi:hypothetical protein
MTDPVFDVVRELARALDRDDFTAAAGLIAPNCVYDTGRGVLSGTDDIVASYQSNSAWGRAQFDELLFQSKVAPPVGRRVEVRFVDILRKGKLEYRHECIQEFTVGKQGKVVKIVHQDLPGEIQALYEFFRQCGIEPEAG